MLKMTCSEYADHAFVKAPACYTPTAVADIKIINREFSHFGCFFQKRMVRLALSSLFNCYLFFARFYLNGVFISI